MSSTAPIDPYGVIRRNVVSGELDLAEEELLRLGYTIIENAVPVELLDTLKAALDDIFASQTKAAGGVEAMQSLRDTNVVRLPLAYDHRFLALATPEPVMALVRRVLGENFVLIMQNGIINPPDRGFEQARYHRDLNYQHWTSSRPLALNFLICLDPFTPENGASVVLPGSHKFEAFPSDEFVRRHEVQVRAPPGSAIVMDAMAYHRAGHNGTARPRVGVNHVVGVPPFGQQIDIPRCVPAEWANDPFLETYLGFRWNPKPSVDAWRTARKGQ
jgi:ectoine hydroxylase-related dioxygenase (phytanoyl-CoA dioxygenase family)